MVDRRAFRFRVVSTGATPRAGHCASANTPRGSPPPQRSAGALHSTAIVDAANVDGAAHAEDTVLLASGLDTAAACSVPLLDA